MSITLFKCILKLLKAFVHYHIHEYVITIQRLNVTGSKLVKKIQFLVSSFQHCCDLENCSRSSKLVRSGRSQSQRKIHIKVWAEKVQLSPFTHPESQGEHCVHDWIHAATMQFKPDRMKTYRENTACSCFSNTLRVNVTESGILSLIHI